MTTSATAREEFVDVAGSRLHVAIAGSGDPIVVLHQDIGSPGIEAPFVQALAQTNTVYLPTHPGFDKQDVPEWARHPRDLAVMHPDGYIQITDRAKDIIISGGENISSIEVENALYSHEGVLEAAVVARPDERWGESPCAFVALKPDAQGVSEAALIDHCRDHLAHFKAPRTVVFGDLPKTATGKIKKFELRERARAL